MCANMGTIEEILRQRGRFVERSNGSQKSEAILQRMGIPEILATAVFEEASCIKVDEEAGAEAWDEEERTSDDAERRADEESRRQEEEKERTWCEKEARAKEIAEAEAEQRRADETWKRT